MPPAQLLESHGAPEPFVEPYTRPRTATGDPGTVDPTDPHTIDAPTTHSGSAGPPRR
ncbi:hypothetical protein V1634_19495 [Plantactinospora veratri]|uniref:Uncharacterized protein n=1 Tax=Plantactinospora veratri TaxID=1436122 RepID=A0ABU7SGE6_9ACTN